MKKSGFTLIELLAVIVILAIIALIAMPVITGVVEKAKKNAAKTSAYGYIDSIEKQIMINQLKGEDSIIDGLYTVDELNVSLKGKSPENGWLEIEKNQIVDCSFQIDKYYISCGINKKLEFSNSLKENPKTYIVRYNYGDMTISSDGYSNFSDINKPVFLKYTFDDDVIIKKEVCAMLNGKTEPICILLNNYENNVEIMDSSYDDCQYNEHGFYRCSDSENHSITSFQIGGTSATANGGILCSITKDQVGICY